MFVAGTDLRKSRAAVVLGACTALLALTAGASAAEPFPASAQARVLDRQLDWEHAKLIVVQEASRYKTLDSFARENIAAIYGKEHFPGLSPIASLLEWLFNRAAYTDTPLVRVKDRGLQIHFTTDMPAEQRDRIRATGYMTPRELELPIVEQRLRQLEPRVGMNKATGRVREAQAMTRFMERFVQIVPPPGQPADAAWFTPQQLRCNAALAVPAEQRPSVAELQRRFGAPAPGISPQQAVQVVGPWETLREAWRAGDAAGVQRSLDRLAEVLPTFAAPGVYPSVGQRRAEAQYYGMHKFMWGWMIYFLGILVSVGAVITRWRLPWYFAVLLLLAAMGVHAYGVGLRWYILGRIPVANMFEALVASAWVGIALALVVEFAFRTRVFLLAAHVTGFFALVTAGYILPGGGTITAIMGILDNIMLRIHTVMIISSYALIFLAAVIAVVYLFGYYFHTQRLRSGQAGLLTAIAGGLLWVLASGLTYETVLSPSGFAKLPGVQVAAGLFATLALLAAIILGRKGAGLPVVGAALLVAVFGTLAVGHVGFSQTFGWVMFASGLLWSTGTGLGHLLVTNRSQPAAALAGNVGLTAMQRPILAGGAPGDEGRGQQLPTWLHHIDWSHLIILNMVFVMLFFGGIVLGAAWADYSWGRPWGWDPKETFALNTWIIYAILIHVRFVVKRRGLWTAWLSLLGCALMLFNWFVVNFYIVGLHSYA